MGLEHNMMYAHTAGQVTIASINIGVEYRIIEFYTSHPLASFKHDSKYTGFKLQKQL